MNTESSCVHCLVLISNDCCQLQRPPLLKPGTYALQLLSACAAVIELLIAINLTVKFKKFVDTISQLM